MVHKKSNLRLCSVIKITRLPESKRSQQEIAGFVLIVLIVAVIGVVFLSITIGNPKPERVTSIEASNILGASMYYTTECVISFIPQYKEIQDLIRDCYLKNNKECLNGREVCMVLEEDLKKIISRSLNVHEDSKNKAYKVDIYFSEEKKPNEEILSFKEGNFANCTSVVAGSHLIPVSSFRSGNINAELSVCRG